MKNKYSISVIGGLILLCGALSCSKQNEGNLTPVVPVTPPSACDTSNMKYTANVLPILQANCYSCHGSGSTGGSGGISLDGYAAIKRWADNGTLVGTITHADGFVAMPYGKPKLDTCSINKIISWVKNGAQNN